MYTVLCYVGGVKRSILSALLHSNGGNGLLLAYYIYFTSGIFFFLTTETWAMLSLAICPFYKDF